MSGKASLNHVYRTVWNEAIGVMVAIAEVDGSPRKASAVNQQPFVNRYPPATGIGLLALSIAIAWGGISSNAIANPAGGVAVNGQASFSTQGNKLVVTTQNGAGQNHSAINWQSFSIPAGNTTYFQQPSTNSTSINRVVTNTPSQIFGTLGSNGNLVLVNQSGITVGRDALVDTAGFTASSLNMRDSDAVAGRMRFGDGTAVDGGVSALGNILARSGDVVLMGSSVATGKDALIQAPNGTTLLAAGQQIELTGRGLEGITLQVQAPSNEALNLGALKGDAVGVFAGTLKHSGAIRADGVSLQGGKVVLKAVDTAIVGGSVAASASNGAGGSVRATANKIALKSDAIMDVSSSAGGGEILVGGGWQGKDTSISNAEQSVVATGAQIKADALEKGNGGTVVVWADGSTRFGGNVSARGGAQGGNGGAAEVSGKQFLDFRGGSDLGAVAGRAGTLLLDPLTLDIGTIANVDGLGGGDVTGDITSGQYTGYGSQITAAQVGALLATGSLSLAATGNVTVSSAITKTGATTTSLTLTSDTGNIAVTVPISATGGALNLNLNATIGSVSASGNISTNGGNLTATATGGVTLTGGVDAGAGAIKLTATNGAISTSTSSMTAGSLEVNSSGNISVIGNNPITLLAAKSTNGSITIEVNKPGGTTVGTVGATSGLSGYGGVVLSQYDSTNGGITVDGNIDGKYNAGFGSVTLSIPPTSSLGGITINSGRTVQGTGLTVYTEGGPIAVNGTINTGVGNVSLTSGYTSAPSAWGNITGLGPITAGSLTLKAADQFDAGNGALVSLTGFINASSITVDSGAGTTLSNTGNTLGSITAYNKTTGNIVIKGTGNSTLFLTNGASGGGIDAAIGGAITINHFGTNNGDVVISTGTTLNASGMDGAPVVGSGQWLIYSNNPANNSFGGFLNPTFQQYGAPPGTVAAGTGNGHLYSVSGPTVSAILDSTSTVSKVFDGTTSASLTAANYILSGTYGDSNFWSSDGQVAPVFVSAGTGTYSSPNVGTGINVASAGGTAKLVFASGTIYGMTLSSASAAIGTITPARAIASISLTGSRPYDGTSVVNASIFSLSGLLFGETLTLSGAGTVADKNVGVNKPVSLGTLTLGDGTGLASNYTLSGGTYSVSITPAPLTLSTGVVTKIYDGGLSAQGVLTLTNGNLFGSDSLSGGSFAFDNKNVGANKTVSVSAATVNDGNNGQNYTITYANNTSSRITAAPLTLSVAATNKVYDGSVSAQGTLAVTSGQLFGSDALGVGAFEFDNKNVGTNKTVVLSGAAVADGNNGQNYSITYANNTSSSITAAPLTISINAVNKVYDGTVSAPGTLAITSGQLFGSDALSGGSFAFDNKNVGANKTVSVSAATVNDGNNGQNYAISYANNTASSITAAPLTISTSAVTKVYDGTTSAQGTLTGTGLKGTDTLSGGSFAFDNKNAGTNKTVSVSAATVNDGNNGQNYTISYANNTSSSITPKTLTVSGSGLVKDKVYDGSVVADLALLNANLAGKVETDFVSLNASSGTFSDANVGIGKLVTLAGVKLEGADALNYKLDAAGLKLNANISQLPQLSWRPGLSSGLWSDPNSWGLDSSNRAIPSRDNVKSVVGLDLATVTYGDAAGSSSVDALSAAGLIMTGGSLTVRSGLGTTSVFQQTGGKLVAGGAVSVTQATGNLVAGSISAQSITLTANGAISQTAGLVTGGLLTTQSGDSTVLNSNGNRVSAFRADSTGAGNIEFTNVGVLDVRGLRTVSGSIVLNNIGGISTSGPVLARGGKVTGVANSPLTIGPDGVESDGDIVLTASNLTSAGNLTLLGNVSSSAGSVRLDAAQDFVQNGRVFGANGVSAAAGGTATFGPNATTIGRPVTYFVAGQSVDAPSAAIIGVTSGAGGNAPTDFVLTFLTKFDQALEQQIASAEIPGEKKKDNIAVLVEGQTCTR